MQRDRELGRQGVSLLTYHCPNCQVLRGREQSGASDEVPILGTDLAKLSAVSRVLKRDGGFSEIVC
jgi:hypothetical protein